MAAAFNLTAQLNLQGPTNVGAIVNNIKKQLNNISANVNVKVSPGTSQNIAALNAAFASFNTTLATTATNSNNAANAIRGLTQAIGQANNPLDNLQQNMANNATAANQLTQNLQNLNRTQRVCANDMEELGRQAAGTIRRFAAFGVVTGGIYKLGNAINSASKEFLEFNRELVRVAQVTDTSLSNLTSLTKQIGSLSTTFGVASSDLIKVSSTLAQAGLSAKDTEKALKALALSALAPSFDSLNDTVEGSIALMRQFGIGADQLEGALGSVNAVAAKFAVEASDIITAIQRTGGVFATASKGVATGTEALNQFISVFTSIRATTRESAETISTGLRTIFTRIQRGQTIDALKEYGVVLTDLEGKFVGPYEATRRLSEGLSKLDPRDLRFGQIVEELGGFRQIGKVIPLIQQFAVAQQALKVAQKGQSSLAYDAATAQESVANKMTKVREEFVALIRSIGESKSFQTFVKLSLDLTSQLIRLADAAKNVLPAVLAIAAIRSGPAALSFGRGFIGGLRRNQGGPIGFASGGFVPGQGDGDTVPAMLTPGEFVVRKKAVKAIGVDRLAGINKYAGGGIVNDLDKGVGAAVLEYRPNKSTSGTFSVKIPGQKDKIVTGIKEGLNEKTNQTFHKALDEGIIRGVNYATRIVSQDLGMPTKKIGKGEESQKFLTGINDAAKGNLFEDILRTMKGGPFGGTEAQRPFDFPDGLSGVIKDNFTSLPNKWVDAKASFDAAKLIGDSSLQAKTQRQINIDMGVSQLTGRQRGIQSGKVLGRKDLIKILGLKNDTSEDVLLSRAKEAQYIQNEKTGNWTKKALGGNIEKFAKGGSSEDTVPALLTPGEFVINKKAASRIGLPTLHKMNHADKVQGFNKGGSVQRFVKGGTALAEVQKTDTKTAAALTAALSGKGYTTSRLGPIQNRQLDAVQVQEDFLNFTRKLDSLDLPLNDAIAAIKAWTRATAQGADATQAFDRAMNSSTMSAAHSITNPSITPGGGGRGGGAGAGILGRLKGGIGGLANMSSGAGMLLTMAGGTAIEGMSQAYGGEKTATGRGISAIGGSVLNYGAVGATMGSALGPLGTAIGGATGAVIGLAAGLVQAEEASKEYAVTTATSAKDMASEFSGKAVSEYANAEKPSKEMRQAALTTLATTSLREQELASATRAKAQPSWVGRMLGSKVDANKLAEEQIKGQESSAGQAEQFLFTEMKRSGQTFSQLSKSMNPEELKRLSLDIAEADKGYATAQELNKKEVMDRRNAGDEAGAIEAEKYWAKEQQNLINAAVSRRMAEEDAAIKAQQLAKAQQNMAIVMQNSIMSLERTFDIMEQTGNRFSFELDSVAENAKSMMSGKGPRVAGLSDTMNILKNPQAYSAAERQGAMQRGVSGLDQKTGQNLIRLANFAPRARDTALQISSNAGFDPESQREAGDQIKKQLGTQIRQAFGATDLSSNMVQTLNETIDKELSEAKGGAIDWNSLIEKALGPSFKGAEGANKIIEQQLKIQADLYGQISDISEQYVDNMEKVTERTNALTDMQEKARMSLRSAMGEKLTSKDKIANRARSAADKAGMDSRTYGNVGLMALQIENTMAQRDAKIREKSALENSGASPQALAKVNVELATLQSSLKKASKGLEDLPQELQSNIDDMIGEIQDRVGKMEAQKEAGSRFAEKLVGNTPEEMMGLNRTFALLQNTLNGNIITINKSFVAQQAFAEALRSGKNATEAMRDAQRAFADENKNALGLFSELMGVAGVEGPQFDMMKADLMENFAKAQGMGLEKNPMFQMILDQLRRDPAERAKEDPVVMALVEKIKLAQKMQTDAINTINNNAINAQQTAFSAAIGEFTDKINKAQLNLMVNVQGAAWAGGQNPVQVGVAARAKGGIIYASKGQYVNFEPKGTDTVPAMLTPGEFVVNRKATQDNLPLLKSINSGYYAKGGYLNETGLTASATQGLMEHYVSQSQVLKNPRDRKKFVFQVQRDLRSLKPDQKIAFEVVRQFGLKFKGDNPGLNSLSSSPISGINKFNTIAGQFNQDSFGILEPVIVNPLEKADDLVKKIKESPVEYLQAKTLSNKANKRWSYLGEILANLNTGKKIIGKSPDFENSVFLEDIYGFMDSVEANASKEQKIIREVYDNVGARTGYWFPEQNFRGFSPSNFPKADYFAGGGRAKGSDTVPAMLTPGEFVVNKNSTQKNLGLLKQINKGYSNGGAVRYYQNGGVTGGSSGSSSYGVIDVLGGRLDNFIQQLSQAIPSTVRLEVPQPIPVNVVINGAGILQNVLGGPLGELIATQIREAFARQSRATEGAVGE